MANQQFKDLQSTQLPHRSPETRTAPDTSPVGDSKSKSFIENANTIIDAQTRTLLS